MTLIQALMSLAGIILAVLLPLWIKQVYESLSANVKAFLAAPKLQAEALGKQGKEQAEAMRVHGEVLIDVESKMVEHFATDKDLFAGLEKKINEEKAMSQTRHTEVMQRIDSRMTNREIMAEFEKSNIEIKNLHERVDDIEERVISKMKEGFDDLKLHIDRRR